MSAEAVGHVYRHSPYKGASFTVHLAVADSVNDQHSNTFFMSLGNLATKSRLSRRACQEALRELEDDGWLVLVDYGNHVTPRTYQFRFIHSPVIYETRGAHMSALRGANERGEGRTTFAQTQVRTQEERGMHTVRPSCDDCGGSGKRLNEKNQAIPCTHERASA